MHRVAAPVVSRAELRPGLYLMEVRAAEIAAAAQPGQFVMAHCGESSYDPLLRRPLSIHWVNDELIALLFNVVGRGTHWLSQRSAGEYLDLIGPLGKGFTIYPDSRNLLLVAGGIGIAPLLFLAEAATSQRKSVTLLLGAQTAAHIYSPVMLPPQLSFIPVTEDGSMGAKGLVTDLVPKLVAHADQLFACGPLPMYRTMASQAQLKDKPVQISLETRMGCGMGICYGCSVKTNSGMKQVCKDGPVFELRDITWDKIRDI